MCRPGELWLDELYRTRRGGSKYAPLRLILHLALLLPALPRLDTAVPSRGYLVLKREKERASPRPPRVV
eukprot:4438872-Pyramimonas_sp.AAC.1